nr:glutamine synthetase [Streptomyces sp. DSM 41633]
MVDPGAPLPTDTRGLMKRLHAAFTDRTGLELRTGTEPEMTWEGPGFTTSSRPDSSPAYHIEHLERYRAIYQKVIAYAKFMGFQMVEGDFEDAGQVELNWMYDHSDATADRLMTYRQICKQVARELGIEASFMPKPGQGYMGNGCHHNFSLWRGDVNILADEGRHDLHLTEEGQYA